jgi:hypothetical protein
MTPPDYLYAMLHDNVTGKSIDHYRAFGRRYVPGDIIERTAHEGHIPWTVKRVEEHVFFNTNQKYQKLFVEAGEYVQEFCRHEWDVKQGIQLAVGAPVFERTCTKCKLHETFDYGKAKWT